MVDSVNSGYKAEIQTVAFDGTVKLNSLASTAWSDLSNEIDNSLNGYSFFDAWLELEAATTWTGNIDIYIVPSIDGTNYPDWTGGGTADLPAQNGYFAFSFTVDGATAQKKVQTDMKMPQGKFKFGIRNQGGIGATAQNNILKWRPWNWGAR